MITVWSTKGGVGVSVVAAGLACALSAGAPRRGVLLVDVDGDQPCLFGQDEPTSPGLVGWAAAGTDVPPDALRRLEVSLGGGIWLLPRGHGQIDMGRCGTLASLLAAETRQVVIDLGRLGPDDGRVVLARRSTRSLLVTRACPLALRALVSLPASPTGVVVVRDHRRTLPCDEISSAASSPVVAELAVDPAVGAAVDAGLGRRGLPRPLLRALAAVA